MCKNLKSVLMFALVLCCCGGADAATYTAAELNISRILPSLTSIPKPGPYLSNSTILEMAIENTVYPTAGGGAVKKILPTAIKYGKYMGWAVAASGVGYLVGSEWYKAWHEDEHDIYYDGEGYYEWLEREVPVGCSECSPDEAMADFLGREGAACKPLGATSAMGFYTDGTTAYNVVKSYVGSNSTYQRTINHGGTTLYYRGGCKYDISTSKFKVYTAAWGVGGLETIEEKIK